MIVDHNTEIALKDLACTLWGLKAVTNVAMETPHPFFVRIVVSTRSLNDAGRRAILDAVSTFHSEYARVVSVDVDIQDEESLVVA